MPNLLDIRAEFDSLVARLSPPELQQLALLINRHIDDQRGPAVFDAAAAQRYADLAVGATAVIRELLRSRKISGTSVERPITALQGALERALADVTVLIRDNPRYQPKKDTEQ